MKHLLQWKLLICYTQIINIICISTYYAIPALHECFCDLPSTFKPSIIPSFFHHPKPLDQAEELSPQSWLKYRKRKGSNPVGAINLRENPARRWLQSPPFLGGKNSGIFWWKKLLLRMWGHKNEQWISERQFVQQQSDSGTATTRKWKWGEECENSVIRIYLELLSQKRILLYSITYHQEFFLFSILAKDPLRSSQFENTPSGMFIHQRQDGTHIGQQSQA